MLLHGRAGEIPSEWCDVRRTASVALHYAHYNFVCVHRTLRCTPTLAAGVTDRLWSVEELIEAASESDASNVA